MNSEVIDEGFSEFCNCIVTYMLVFVRRDQLVLSKRSWRRYCGRRPRKSFGGFFKEWSEEALGTSWQALHFMLQFFGSRSDPWWWDGSCWDAFWPVRGHSDIEQNYYQRGRVMGKLGYHLPHWVLGVDSYDILRKIMFWDSHWRMSDFYLRRITSLCFWSPISLRPVLGEVQLGVQWS